MINMSEKMLDISEVKSAIANISDFKVYGDGDTFALLCKASSQEQGWMKSTKVCNVGDDCIVQVTTQQKNPDGSYAVAEALTYVPNANLDKGSNPRKIIPTNRFTPTYNISNTYNVDDVKKLAEEIKKCPTTISKS